MSSLKEVFENEYLPLYKRYCGDIATTEEKRAIRRELDKIESQVGDLRAELMSLAYIYESKNILKV